MLFRNFLVVAIVLSVAFSQISLAAAHEFKIGEVGVATPWARATIGAGKIGVVYLTIHNRGTTGDRLVAMWCVC